MKRALFLLPATLFFGMVGIAFAEETATTTTTAGTTITFPIAELGNCADKQACRTYCEDATHRDVCYKFAEGHRLMTKDEIQKARNYILMKFGSSTPPRNDKEKEKDKEKKPDLNNVGQVCRAYCADPSHRGECMGVGGNIGSTTPRKNEDTRPVPAEIERKYGCSTIAECKMLCEKSPDKCPTTRPLPPKPTSVNTNDGAASFFGWLHFLGL